MYDPLQGRAKKRVWDGLSGLHNAAIIQANSHGCKCDTHSASYVKDWGTLIQI
jgi:hypothetical protein